MPQTLEDRVAAFAAASGNAQDVQGSDKAESSLDERVKAFAAQRTNKPAPMSFGQKSLEVAKGAGKQVLRLGRNVGDIASLGTSALTTPKSVRQKEEEFLKYRNPYQKAGGTASEIAEMAVPIPGLSEVKLGANAPRIAKLGLEMGKGALEFGAKTFAQTGSPKEAATGAKVGAAFGALPTLAKPLLHYASELLGFTTGAGGEAVRTAASSASEKLTKAMRSQITETEIVDDARSALARVKNARADAYRTRLAALPKGNVVPDLSALQSQVNKSLKQYGIRAVRNAKGQIGLDFSRSTINAGPDQAKLAELVSDVAGWGSKPDDLTTLGLDTLKRRIDNLYADTSDVRQIVQNTKSSLRTLLNLKVPGYADMTREYAEATRFIDDITRELSLKERSNPGVVIRKLSNALNQNNEYRKLMLEALDHAAGSELKESVAGASLRPWMPRGIVGRGMLGAEAFGLTTGHPYEALIGTMGSPRIVGEIMSLISVLSRTPVLPGALPRAAVGGAIEAAR